MADGPRAKTAGTQLTSGRLFPCCVGGWIAVVLEIIDLLVCRKIHGCGCFADDPAPRESKLKDKIKNQKRQLAVMNAAAKAGAADDDTMSASGSDGDQRKHSALTCQNAVPRKERGKGADGIS